MIQRIVQIDHETFDRLHLAICDAIWEQAEKSHGCQFVDHETNETQGRDYVVGLFSTVIKQVLEGQHGTTRP